jgi:predicted phage baseplate assembly protein
MPLQAPNLDDRQYSDIVAEAKTLIARYAPEWTNYNESDPGVTLVELFAWLSEILIYRLNQVPDLNYIKFLQLLGIELQAAQPARAELTFTPARLDLVSTIVPIRTQISAPSDAGTPVLFETDESLVVIGAILAAVQTFDGFGYTVQTEKNGNAGQWFHPFGQNPKPGNALMLGFRSPVAFPQDQINLAVSLFTSSLVRPVIQCAGALPPPANLAWEYWNGSLWVTVDIDKDGTRAFSQDGHILFPGPGDDVATAAIGNVSEKLYWIRARIEQTTYEIAPKIAAIRTNTISATQAITFTDEVLGGTDGTPNQTVQVTNTPVMHLDSPLTAVTAGGTKVTISSVRLEIDEGQGFNVWQEVDDFFSSKPNDRVFTIDRNTGVITLGDGEHGQIASINPANTTSNVVARWYRAGGGSNGNVGANTITQIQTSLPGIKSAINYEAATGGTDEETVAAAKQRAQSALQSKNRAVTAGDYEYLASQAPGANVRRTRALPLYHPDFPAGQVPGVVTMIVVPNSEDPNPMPNNTTLQAVCVYLGQHRLLTSELYVVGPVYRKIKVAVQLVVQPGADLATVKNAAQNSLATFFHPLTGGNDRTGWPFGGEIYYSDVYRRILDVDSVLRIQDNQLLIWLDDQPQQFCRDVPINPGELLYNDPAGHSVTAAYAR